MDTTNSYQPVTPRADITGQSSYYETGDSPHVAEGHEGPHEPDYSDASSLYKHPPSYSSWLPIEIEDQPNLSEENSRTSSSKNQWILEIFALIVGILAFIALVAVLCKVDGILLSKWNFKLSVNTIISVLSISLKTPLAFMVGTFIGQGKWSWFRKHPGPLSGFVAFDEASRGPLGCISLLWWLKSRHWASMGAWVTLALLLVDPFLQAVIILEGRLDTVELVEPDKATVSRASHLDFGDILQNSRQARLKKRYTSPVNIYGMQFYPDAGVSAASIMGFVNSSTASPNLPPLYSCRTGNCTWPIYSSVGICGRCNDVSEHIETEHRQGMPDENPFNTEHYLDVSFVENYTVYSLDYHAGRRLLLEYGEGFYNETRQTNVALPHVDMVSVYHPSETYTFKRSSTLLVSFGILRGDERYWENQVEWGDAKPSAMECALEFCGQVFQAMSKGGIFQEDVIPADYLRVPESYESDGEHAMKTTGNMNESFDNSLITYDQLSYATFYNLQPKMPVKTDLQLRLKDGTELPQEVQRTFNISQKAITTMSYYFNQNETLMTLTYLLSNSTSLEKTFATAARMLSNRFREMNNDLVSGATQQWVIYIRVKWMFFIFPVVILLAGIIFSCGAAYDSHAQKLEKMKPDALASMLYGLDDDTREMLRSEKHEGNELGNIIVQLEDEKGGPRLRSGV